MGYRPVLEYWKLVIAMVESGHRFEPLKPLPHHGTAMDLQGKVTAAEVVFDALVLDPLRPCPTIVPECPFHQTRLVLLLCLVLRPRLGHLKANEEIQLVPEGFILSLVVLLLYEADSLCATIYLGHC